MRIEHDLSRFKQIVRGKIRQNLRKYVTHGEMIGRKGRDLVSIPIPQLDVPHFRYGNNGSGGVGQGEGEEGTPVASGEARKRHRRRRQRSGRRTCWKSKSRSKNWPRSWARSSNCPASSPRVRPTSNSRRPAIRAFAAAAPNRYGTSNGRTWRPCGGRSPSNTYVPNRPRVVPIREDKRYRAWTEVALPDANAAIIYMMDVSGSMTDDQKEVVRTASFWLDTWLKSQYKGLERRYIIHDAAAKEVDEETFYHTRESGGTRISSAYKVAADLIERVFPPSEWNIYCFQFSDGDNWGEDNEKSLELLKTALIPARQPVLLRPGRKPLRQRRVHSLARLRARTSRS